MKFKSLIMITAAAVMMILGSNRAMAEDVWVGVVQVGKLRGYEVYLDTNSIESLGGNGRQIIARHKCRLKLVNGGELIGQENVMYEYDRGGIILYSVSGANLRLLRDAQENYYKQAYNYVKDY